MLKIYQRLWQVNWAEQWQYRANLVMYLLYWLVSPIIFLAVWTTIASTQGSIGGYTANDFITYYLLVLVFDQLTSDITIHLLAYKIQDGTLSGELIRPVHPVLTNTLVNNLAFKALILLALIPVWLVLVLLFQPDFSAVTLPGLLLALLAAIPGFLISFFIGSAITALAFWTTRVYSLMEVEGVLFRLFSGVFAPLTLLPGWLQQAALYLPFPYAIYFPVQLALGRLPQDQIVLGFASAGVWLVISAVAFVLIWNAGVKRFSAVGA